MCNIILVAGVRDSYSIFLQIILHSKLLQDNGYISLYCTLYHCCLFILYIVVCLLIPYPYLTPTSFPLPLGNHQWNCWIIWQLYLQFFEETPYRFPQWLYQFTVPPTVCKCSISSTSSPTFVICRLFDNSLSDRCEGISHCSFDLHFSNNQ